MVCVAAVVSGFKKAVSAVAAAVVGVGLLCSPIESVQGQSGIPEVVEFCLISNAASDYELTRGYLACVTLMDVSASSPEWVRTVGLPAEEEGGYTEDGGGGSGYFLFRPRRSGDNKVINDGRWLLVVFHVSVSRNSRASLSVLVTDSEGNEYVPYNVSVRYDGWRGW